jgi:hypothetical protein
MIAVGHSSIIEPPDGEGHCSGTQLIAGLAAGEAIGDGDGAAVDMGVVGVGTALGVGDGVGAAQPASRVQNRASAKLFIVNWTARVPARLCKGSIVARVHVWCRDRKRRRMRPTSGVMTKLYGRKECVNVARIRWRHFERPGRRGASVRLNRPARRN